MREDLIEIEIGAFAKVQNGYAFKSKEYVDKGLRIIRIANVQSGEIIDRDPKFYPESRLLEFNDYVIEEDDFLISLTGNVGRVGRIDKSLLPALLNQRVGKLNLQTSNIEKSYLYHFLNSRTFVHQVIKGSKGVAQLNTSSKKIEAIKIPIVPLPEQRAIVAKIEELFSDLDKGIADLKKAQDQLKVYRQAVLKKAFEGELTKEWREQQTDLPTADELLEQIKEERQKHYEEQIENWKQAVKSWEENGKEGKKPSRISKPNNVPDPENSDIENYEQLPNNWGWSRFGNVTYKIGDVDHKMPKTVNEGLPYLSTGNIRPDGTIDFNNAKIISRTDFDRLALKIKPEKGDIIFPRYGTIGRNILIDFEREFLVSYACAIIKNIKKLMNSKFVLYYSISPVVKKEINRYVVQTTQANIGIASIESFVFPLCSTEEQNQIVREIESRLSICDQVEQSISQSLEKAKALRQSILKKAFEGKLLTITEIEKCKAEKDYEPASVLLERIQAEKKKK